MHDVDQAVALGELTRFRQEFYGCLTARADALFELADAVLCAEGPVVSLAELSLTAEHRRGHGAMYDALACGGIDPARLSMVLAGLRLPRRDGQLVVAIDVSPWPRPDAECSPQRLHCHRPCRCDGVRQTIPGWPYSVAAALGTGRSSWTAPLDIRRLGPRDDLTDVTETQIRDLHTQLTAVGQLSPEDPPLLIVLDSGYDLVRLTWLLCDLPVHLLGRQRSDRVMFGPGGPRRGTQPGRQPRHGHRFAFADPATHPEPHTTTSGTHSRYGATRARAWQRLHPRPERRGTWSTHPGQLPLVEGTIIHLAVEHLPGNRTPKPVWLWFSHPITDTNTGTVVDHLWRTYLRRFDLEHTFRFFKQVLGFTRPRPRHGEQADRWAWLIVAAYTQLHLARPLTPDLRRPWEKPLAANKITPGRVRRSFRRIRRTTGNPTNAPKATHPGPGRPPGRTSQPAPRHPVGKTPKTG
ncbi:MAG TPA: NF041680 family putative transposase [Actinomycetes bacterium]